MSEVKSYRFVSGDFANLKLNSEVPGQQAFWKFMMDRFEADPLFVLRFNSDVTKRGAGGGYRWLKGVNFIELASAETYPSPFVIEDNTVTFPSDIAFGVFMHECMHYEHLFIDEGRCIAPLAEGEYEEDICMRPDDYELTWQTRRRVEFEAGYRAILRNDEFNAIDRRTMRNLQFWNIFMYELLNDVEKAELVRQFAERHNLLENNGLMGKCAEWMNVNVFDKIGKFSAWADPNSIISTMEELKNA